MAGDDFPNINHDFQGSGEQGLVVIKFTQILGVTKCVPYEQYGAPMSKVADC